MTVALRIIGQTGPANTLTISSVTTLAPGSNATATISGQSPNQTIALGLPAGLAAQISSVSVTMGAPGSIPTAVVGGSAPNFTIALTLPPGTLAANSGAAITGSLTVSGASTLAALTSYGHTITNSAAGQQSLVTFSDIATAKWQIGKQADNSFLIYDFANTSSALAISTAGQMTLGESGQIVIPKTGAVAVSALNVGGALTAGSISNTPIAGSTGSFTTLSFGSASGTAGQANKIALYGAINGIATTTYGFGISANSLDYVATGAHTFYSNVAGASTKIGVIGPTAGQTNLVSLDGTPIGLITPAAIGATTIGASGAINSGSTITSNASGAQFLGRGYVHYSDTSNYYLLLTGTQTPTSTTNSLRPISVGLSTGNVVIGNGLSVVNGLSVDALTMGGAITLNGGQGVQIGNAVSAGWYHDANNLAARLPVANGTLYVQGPGGSGLANLIVSNSITAAGTIVGTQISTSGSAAGFNVTDRTNVASGNAVIYRTGGINALYDSGYGNVLTWDKTGAVVVGGAITAGSTIKTAGEFQSTAGFYLRSVAGNYGRMWYSDGNATYFLLTNSGDQYGNYNNLRPLFISASTGLVTISNGLFASGGLTTSNMNSGPLAGYRNLVINGNFIINQRAYGSGGALGAYVYGHDRWHERNNASAAYTYSQPSTANGQATHAIDCAINITSGKIGQEIEGNFIAGGQYTLSWSGTAAGELIYFDGSNGITLASGASPLTGNIPAGCTATVRFSTGTLGLVQLENGSVATPFERRNPTLEFEMCQRYFQIVQASLQGYAQGTGNTYRMSTAVNFTPMRATPTAIISATAYSSSGTPSVSSITPASFVYIIDPTTSAVSVYALQSVTLNAEL